MNLLSAKFDSDEDDEDYIPEEGNFYHKFE